jgi:sec-independent protein translocase protein TatA
MPGWLSPWELLILLVVVLLVFGPKRLPEMGRGLGKGMREFKNSIAGKDEGKDEAKALPQQNAGTDEPPTADAPETPRERDTVA